jgi:hypothetical protein
LQDKIHRGKFEFFKVCVLQRSHNSGPLTRKLTIVKQFKCRAFFPFLLLCRHFKYLTQISIAAATLYKLNYYKITQPIIIDQNYLRSMRGNNWNKVIIIYFFFQGRPEKHQYLLPFLFTVDKSRY